MNKISELLINTFLPNTRPVECLHHLKQNWYFPLTALAFFYPEVQWGNDFCKANLTIPSMALTFIAMILVASQVSDLWSAVRWLPWWLNVFVILSAIGICWRLQTYAFDFFCTSLQKSSEQAYPISMALALGSFLFVYVCLAHFWQRLTRLFQETKVFSDLHPFEVGIYAFLFVLTLLFAARLFLMTTVFYDARPDGFYDLIYTSDSGGLVRNMGWLYLTFSENDLRQPLFAVFAAPFVGAPYALGEFLGLSITSEVILINTLQITLLFVANFMLSRLLNLTTTARVCFMVMLTATYSTLLNVLMIEQYVTAYFWLVLTLVCLLRGQRNTNFALYGAGGTLLTSLALLPVIGGNAPGKTPKRWLQDMLRRGAGFAALLLAWGRFDVYYSLLAKIESLCNFTGEEISFSDRLRQFTGFVHDCFLAPAASVGEYTLSSAPHIAWMLEPVEHINWFGVLLLALCLISAAWNWEERIARLSIYWIGFSLLLLVVLGWGTQENGLTLYVLYFCWAFFVLLFMLIQRTADSLKQPLLLPVVCIAVTALLLLVNLAGVKGMLAFGLEYYPL